LDRDRSAFFFQLFCTFIFVFLIMAIKGTHTTPSQDGVLKPLAVSLTLLAMIQIAAKQSGACYNPAVALA